MAEGLSGGPKRFYRRRSLAEQGEAFHIATSEFAVFEAKAAQVAAAAEVRINKLDLQIQKLKQQAAEAATRKRPHPNTRQHDVAIGSGPRGAGVREP